MHQVRLQINLDIMKAHEIPFFSRYCKNSMCPTKHDNFGIFSNVGFHSLTKNSIKFDCADFTYAYAISKKNQKRIS